MLRVPQRRASSLQPGTLMVLGALAAPAPWPLPAPRAQPLRASPPRLPVMLLRRALPARLGGHFAFETGGGLAARRFASSTTGASGAERERVAKLRETMEGLITDEKNRWQVTSIWMRKSATDEEKAAADAKVRDGAKKFTAEMFDAAKDSDAWSHENVAACLKRTLELDSWREPELLTRDIRTAYYRPTFGGLETLTKVRPDGVLKFPLADGTVVTSRVVGNLLRRYVDPPFIHETKLIADLCDCFEAQIRQQESRAAAAVTRLDGGSAQEAKQSAAEQQGDAPWTVPVVHGDSGAGKTLGAVMACAMLERRTKRPTYCMLMTGHDNLGEGLRDEFKAAKVEDRSALARNVLQCASRLAAACRDGNADCDVVVCMDEVGPAYYADFVTGLLRDTGAVADMLRGCFGDCPRVALCIVGTGSSFAAQQPGLPAGSFKLLRAETDLLPAVADHYRVGAGRKGGEALAPLVAHLTTDTSTLSAATRALLKNARAAALYFQECSKAPPPMEGGQQPPARVLHELMQRTVQRFKNLNALNSLSAEKMMQFELWAVAVHHNPSIAAGISYDSLQYMIERLGMLTDVTEARTPDDEFLALPGSELCVRNKDGRAYETSPAPAAMLRALALPEPVSGDGFAFAAADFLWLAAGLVQRTTRWLYLDEARLLKRKHGRAAEQAGVAPVAFVRRVAAVLAQDDAKRPASDTIDHHSPRLTQLATKFEAGTCFDAPHEPGLAKDPIALQPEQSAVIINAPGAQSWDVLLAVRTGKKLHCWPVRCAVDIRDVVAGSRSTTAKRDAPDRQLAEVATRLYQGAAASNPETAARTKRELAQRGASLGRKPAATVAKAAFTVALAELLLPADDAKWDHASGTTACPVELHACLWTAHAPCTHDGAQRARLDVVVIRDEQATYPVATGLGTSK